ncbi:hypothetical protein BXZ70DRAFT_1000996 [Cristinia sonorae]|uniref:Probable quinone oxidoreductase n=1 Tax=Cristinia sonorae TaxID=1940300 RepID=A0A8K0UL32_9AGAR|nr:hypothetical protein BXZ70DRAFT_1000996 [Cristinia sonorae]
MVFPDIIPAIALTEKGGFEVIKRVDIPFPKPSPAQILVKVNYVGINFIDNYFRSGLYPVPQWPYILGEESSGTIVSLPTDTAVLNDPDYQQRKFAVGQRVAIKERAQLAEYSVAHWKNVIPVPNTVSLLVAAATPAQAYTALTFVEEAYNIRPGDVVFIHTVAGGLGLNLAQIAKLRGATVIGTTSTPEKAKLAKDNGADHVILYKEEDVVKRVLEITNGEGVHATFDGVGKDGVEIDFQIIRRKGTIILVGNASGPVPPIAPLRLAQKNIKLLRPIVDNYLTTPSEYFYYGQKLNDLLSQGKLKVQITTVSFTEEAVRQAEMDLTGGKTAGKLIVKVREEE